MAKGKQQTKQSARGRLLRRARQKKGLSLGDLANAMDVSSAAVSGWELGIKRPNDRLVPKLANALGLTPDALLDILEKP